MKSAPGNARTPPSPHSDLEPGALPPASLPRHSHFITRTLRDLIHRALDQSGTSILSVEWLEKKHLHLVYWYTMVYLSFDA